MPLAGAAKHCRARTNKKGVPAAAAVPGQEQ